MPNNRELQSIVDYRRVNPSIDPVFGAFPDWYWSSASYAVHADFAWGVEFGGCIVGAINKVDGYYVRAVRSGP